MYDPSIITVDLDPIPVEVVPKRAKETLSKFSLPDFKIVYQSAVDGGMVSEQAIGERFGKHTLEVLRSPKMAPNPAQCRLILAFIASLNPEDASGKKEPWRHAHPRPKQEEPNDPQPL